MIAMQIESLIEAELQRTVIEPIKDRVFGCIISDLRKFDIFAAHRVYADLHEGKGKSRIFVEDSKRCRHAHQPTSGLDSRSATADMTPLPSLKLAYMASISILAWIGRRRSRCC